MVNVAISCDSIISRDYSTSVVESVLALYERAELYTIVHKAGQVLGPVEQRRIQSTYLSNLVNDEYAAGESWWKKSYLIPGACKNLTVPCNVDVLVNISSGFSQGFSKCEGVYQITYLIENKFSARKSRFLTEKLFSRFVEAWAIKKLKKSDELWVTNQRELDFWKDHHSNVSIMPPFFKASDYPLFPKAIRKSFPNDFLCFDSSGLSLEQAQKIIEKCVQLNIKFKFVGRDEHLIENISSEYKENFFGERCSGELAPFLAASRGFISLQEFGFPSAIMNALSTGTPIAILDRGEVSAFFSEKEGIFRFGNFESLLERIPELFSSMEGFDPEVLHKQTNKYHDLKFRGEFVRRMKSLPLKSRKEVESVDC